MSEAPFVPRFRRDAYGDIVDRRKTGPIVDLAKIPPRAIPARQPTDEILSAQERGPLMPPGEPLSWGLVKRAGRDILAGAEAIPPLARVAATEAVTTVPQLLELGAGAGAATRAAIEGEPVLPAFASGMEDVRGRIPLGEEANAALESAYEGAAATPIAAMAAAAFTPGGPAKKAAKTARKVAKRGMAAVNFRAMPAPAAHAAARQGVHLIPDPKTGQFVGAPRGFTDIKQIEKQRQHFDSLVAEGAGGAEWYERMRDMVEEAAGWDAADQDRLAAALAIFSPQSTPETNLGFAIDALNAKLAQEVPRLRGGSVGVRTPGQWKKLGELRQKPATEVLGPKTGIYYQQGNPSRPFTHTGTNDIFHARALGFWEVDKKTGKRKPWSAGLTAQQHAYMDGETLLAVDRANQMALGGKTNWTAPQVQAAAWVAEKGRSLAKSRPKLGRAGALEEAAKGYGDYLGKHTARIPIEETPGRATGHLTNIIDEPFAAKQAYAGGGWRDEQGRDILSSAQGLLNRPMLEATGSYTPSGVIPTGEAAGIFDRAVAKSMLRDLRAGTETDPMKLEIQRAFDQELGSLGVDLVNDSDEKIIDKLEAKAKQDFAEMSGGGAFGDAPTGGELEVSPTDVVRPLVALDPRTKSIRKRDMQMLEDQSLARAAFDAQEMVAPHFVTTRGPQSRKQGLTIPLNRKLTEDEVRKLNAVAGEHSLWVADTAEGVTLGPFNAKSRGTILRRAMKKTDLPERIEEIVGVKPELARVDSRAVDLSADWRKSAESLEAAPITERLLEREPQLLSIDTPAVRDKVLRNYTRDLDYAKRGFQVNEKLQNLRHAFGTGGWDAVKKALKAGVPLPAMAVIMRELGAEGEGGA